MGSEMCIRDSVETTQNNAEQPAFDVTELAQIDGSAEQRATFAATQRSAEQPAVDLLPRAEACTIYGALSMPALPEKRIAKDGIAYTLDEFCEHYGVHGTRLFTECPSAGQPEPEQPHADVSSSQIVEATQRNVEQPAFDITESAQIDSSAEQGATFAASDGSGGPWDWVTKAPRQTRLPPPPPPPADPPSDTLHPRRLGVVWMRLVLRQLDAWWLFIRPYRRRLNLD